MAQSDKSVQKRALWQERITLFQESGQSVAKWCSEQDIPEHQLRYWLRKNMAEQNNTAVNTSSRWIALEPSEESVSTGIMLWIGSLRLEIQRGFDPQVLTEVIRTLTSSC